MKYLFVVGLFFLMQETHSQANAKAPNIIGRYFYYSDDSLIRYILELKNDGSYYFHKLEDLIVKAAAGEWRIVNDTLILNSRYQEHAVRLKVKESITKDKYASFGPVSNNQGDNLLALVFINKDTAKPFDPLDENHKIESGGIKSLSVMTGTIISEPYFLKNIQANKFEIVVDMEGSVNTYLFMNKYKMLISKNTLCPIVDSHVDGVVSSYKGQPIALIKK